MAASIGATDVSDLVRFDSRSAHKHAAGYADAYVVCQAATPQVAGLARIALAKGLEDAAHSPAAIAASVMS